MISILVDGDFSCEIIAAQFKHENANHHPATDSGDRMPPFLRAATLGSPSSVEKFVAFAMDATVRRERGIRA